MLHHLTAILAFFARERPLSLTDNQTLIISRSVSLPLAVRVSLPLCSLGYIISPSSWYRVPLLFGLSEIAGHSIYISVLFADKRVSMATISSGRMGPIVFLLAPPISRLVPLLPSPSLVLQLFLQFFAVPASGHLRSSDVVPSIGPGGRLQLWRRVEESSTRRISRPVAFTIARCTHRPILTATGHYVLIFRQGNENLDEMHNSRELSILLRTCESCK